MSESLFQEKNISKAVILLGLPAMLGQLTTLIYNMADTFFVSLSKDPNQIAAVTLCAPIMLIIMSLGSLFGIGSGSLIARMLGKGEDEKAGKVANYCFYTTALCSIVVLILGVVFLTPIVNLTGADAVNAQLTKDYLSIIFIGAPFIMVSNAMLHVFRSLGLVRQGTTGLMIGNISNIILDYILIVSFDMGVRGAAIATSAGFVLNVIYYVVCIAKLMKQEQSTVSLSLRQYQPNREITGQVLSIGIPGALVTVLMSLGNMVLNNYIGRYGSDAVAAYGIAYRVNSIAVMLLVGMTQGVTPLIGYCYGAGEKERLKKVMSVTMQYSLLLGTLLSAVFVAGRNLWTGLFLSGDELVQLAALILCIQAIANPVVGIGNMGTAYFQAIGKPVPSLILTCCKNVVLYIPAIIVLNMLFELNGVVSALPVIEFIIAALAWGLYKRDMGREEAKTYNDKILV